MTASRYMPSVAWVSLCLTVGAMAQIALMAVR